MELIFLARLDLLRPAWSTSGYILCKALTFFIHFLSYVHLLSGSLSWMVGTTTEPGFLFGMASLR